MSRSSSSRSYIVKRFPVPRSVFEMLEPKLTSLSSKQMRFFKHIFACSLLANRGSERRIALGWLSPGIELPIQVIRQHFLHRFSSRPLAQAQLLQVSGYCEGKCRTYSVHPDLFAQAITLFSVPTAEASKHPTVDLFTGRAYVSPRLVKKDTETGLAVPDLVRDAAARIRACLFNGRALDEHLERMRQQCTDPRRLPQERAKAWRRLQNDETCAMRLKFGCVPRGGPLYEYRPSFRPQEGGRIGEIAGGVQSCSREMKRAAFEGVPDVHNYDLRTAQAWILLQELERAGLERAWLATYLDEHDAAGVRAKTLGIPKDAYKRCFYATIMGARSKYMAADKNAMFDALVEGLGDESAARRLFPTVHDALGPLRQLVDAWHAWLVGDERCHHLRRNRRGKRHLVNACGMRLRLDDKTKAGASTRRAAAFILQGQEAAYIHNLTLLADEYGFVPISNQHDGLVTLGTVPRAAHDEAARRARLRYAELDEKPSFGAVLPLAA